MRTHFVGSCMELEIPPVPERLLNPHICDMGFVRPYLVGPFPMSTPPKKSGVYVTSEASDTWTLGIHGVWRKRTRKGWRYAECNPYHAGREEDPATRDLTSHYWWGFTEDFYKTLKEYHENHT